MAKKRKSSKKIADVKDSAEPLFKNIPIEFVYPDNIVGMLANNLVVQHDGHEFYLSFYQVQPPPMIGEPEEIKKRLDAIESVPAKCVARIIVSKDRMPGFVEVLQTNLEKFQSRSRVSSDSPVKNGRSQKKRGA